MKKIGLLMASLTTFILFFINSWFSDQLIEYFFVFALIPSFVIFISFIICIIKVIKNLITGYDLFSFLSLIILILIIIFFFFFPFRNAKIKFELDLYEKNRKIIIEKIKNNYLNADENGNVILPKEYKNLSTSGSVFVYQNDEKGQVVGFWVFRGMLSGSIEIIYSTGGEELIRKNETGHPIIYIEKLKENWYYVETDY